MATIADRKLAELKEKLAGVDADFDRWVAQGEPGMPLRKHRTQMFRLTEQLRGLAGRISLDLGSGPDVLRECRRLQMRILEVHRLWDFYRTKLSLRYVEWYRPFLATADEFAWKLYEPVAQGKEPPLVYLSGEFSPFTHLRDTPFAVEDVPDALDSVGFLQVVTRLPVPVIGLPWYQLAHIPDAVVIAHEVGHAVERDCGLTETTMEHLRTVELPRDRRSAWFTWLPEVFADLYGVLSAGPAFVSALADLLAVDPVTAESTEQLHPPASVRIALTTKALEITGFPDEAAARRAHWQESYPLSGPYLSDVDSVVAALLHGIYPQFGDVALHSLISFTADQQRAAAVAAEAVLSQLPPPTTDVRALVAAARMAFDQDPAGFTAPRPGQLTAQELIVDRIVKSLGDKPRSGRPAAHAVDDRAAGAALYDLIERTTP